jgi:membrane-anchored protein YejM (alkaline phosphatase superfamily)
MRTLLYKSSSTAMVSKADESVGKVVSALEETGVLDNTIILFYSDNGAPTRGTYSNHGSNYPLRDVENSFQFFNSIELSLRSKKQLLGKAQPGTLVSSTVL